MVVTFKPSRGQGCWIGYVGVLEPEVFLPSPPIKDQMTLGRFPP